MKYFLFFTALSTLLSATIPVFAKPSNLLLQKQNTLIESFKFTTSLVNPSTSQFETWASIETRNKAYTREYIISKTELYCNKLTKNSSIDDDFTSGPTPNIDHLTVNLLETELLYLAVTMLCPTQMNQASKYVNFN